MERARKRVFGFANGLRELKIPSSCGGRSSMVEPQIVVLVVAGSSPVDHPTAASRRKLQVPKSKLQPKRDIA